MRKSRYLPILVELLHQKNLAPAFCSKGRSEATGRGRCQGGHRVGLPNSETPEGVGADGFLGARLLDLGDFWGEEFDFWERT